jgi:predicted secreted protein
MGEGISAFGTTLKIGDGASPEVFSDIAEVTNISGPGMSMDTIDVTNHGSAGGWKEYAGGLLDGGEVKLELNFLPADTSQKLLATTLAARTKKNFKLEFPDTANTTWSFSAFVTNFEPSAPVDGKLGASVTLKITGQPALSA